MTGLRERKKTQTKNAIQQQALRLFRERGFAETTMEQVAEAAAVAPSTVFRYFPTKESLAVLDEYHSMADRFTDVFAAQPADLSMLDAMRRTLRQLFEELSPADLAARRERDLLLIEVPALAAANLELLRGAAKVVAEQVAHRAGRPADDTEVVTFTGAVLGVAVASIAGWADQPTADPAELIDSALARLSTGWPW